MRVNTCVLLAAHLDAGRLRLSYIALHGRAEIGRACACAYDEVGVAPTRGACVCGQS